MDFIQRSYPAEFRADSDSGLIVGVPVVFDTPTDICGCWQETISRGAISPEVLSNDVAFYFNHDLSGKKIARSIIPIDKSGGMDFQITDTNIIMRANANRKRTDVNDLYLAIEDRVIDGMSFMFRVQEERWEDVDTDYPKRFITKIAPIIEVSAVNYPAYKSTSRNVARGDLLTESDKAVLEKIRAERRAKADNFAKIEKEKRELELAKVKALYL